MVAAQKGHTTAVAALIDARADLNVQSPVSGVRVVAVV